MYVGTCILSLPLCFNFNLSAGVVSSLCISHVCGWLNHHLYVYVIVCIFCVLCLCCLEAGRAHLLWNLEKHIIVCSSVSVAEAEAFELLLLSYTKCHPLSQGMALFRYPDTDTTVILHVHTCLVATTESE